MPRLTGPELFARLRASGRRVPAFAFWTGYTSREIATTVDPTVPLLEKPWSLRSLAALVRRCLDRRSGGHSPPRNSM
jgi:FixJ family two-component response regulator